jgi:hypothetical protein
MTMPSVLDDPELVEYVETHDFAIEETLERELLKPRRARPGFWRTLAHTITTHLTPRPFERSTPEGNAYRSFETPMDRLARETPFLAAYALAII